MGFIDEITTVRFNGRNRLREITVIADVLEDPVRARLLVDGDERARQDLPAQFDLGGGAAVEVTAKGRTITDCAIVADGQRTSLTLAPDSLVRRYLHVADGHPAAEIVRGIVFFVFIPILLIAGLARLINVPLLDRPLSAIGIVQPIDLPWPTSWWFVPLAVTLLFLLGVEEDVRKAYRRFMIATSEPAAPTMTGSATTSSAGGTPNPLVSLSPVHDPGKGMHRLDQWGEKVDVLTRARFTGRHAGHDLSVVFDFFDVPTHARLIVDGKDQGNKGVPATFDLGGGASLEANATDWAVLECAVLAGGIRTRLTPLDDQAERFHHRFFDAHPVIETMVRSVGILVIVVATILGAIDIYNLILRWDILQDLSLIDWLPQTIDLPIGLSWWQGLLISVLPAVFEFDRDVRRSNKVFRPQSSPTSQVADRA